MVEILDECDFCLYKEGCIGVVLGLDGKCLGFAVPWEQRSAYEAFLSRKVQEPAFAPEVTGTIRKYAVEVINADTGVVCYFLGAFPFFSLEPDRTFSFYTAVRHASLLKRDFPIVKVVAICD